METETLIVQVNENGNVSLPESFMKKYNVSHDMDFCVACDNDIVRGKIV